MNKLIFSRLTLWLLLGMLTFSACHKDVDEFIPNPPIVNVDLGLKVQTDVGGTVFDEDKRPVADAKVTVGNKTTQTNEDGVFIVRQADVYKGFAYVKVEKSGYFLGTRTMVVGDAGLNYAQIMLLTKTNIATIAASTGGDVDFEGVKLTLPANGFIDAAGAAYTGDVKVAAKFIDPTSPDLEYMMPGDLRGFDNSSAQVVLTSYGMFAVELESPNGESLNLNGTAEATIDSPIPASLRSHAPATIPMWHFDEQIGMWMEEGSAERVGDRYVGKVKHFSFWNHDFPGPLVDIEGMVMDQDGNPLEGWSVHIQMVNSPNRKGYGSVDSEGKFYGLIPANEALEITVRDPNCGDVFYTANIGPYSANAVLAPITVTTASSTTTNLTLTLLDCSGNPVTNGYVAVQHNNGYPLSSFTDANGQVTQVYNNCNNLNNITVTGYDLTNQKGSLPFTYPLNGTPIVETINVCENLAEILTYNFLGNTYTDLTPSWALIDSLGMDKVAIISGQVAGAGAINYYNITFDVINEVPGVYPISSFYIEGSNTFFRFVSGSVTITNFGANIGDEITGMFIADMENPQMPGVFETVTGTFIIIRE